MLNGIERNAWGEVTMRQPRFGELEYEGKKRKTRREIFLEPDGWSDPVGYAGRVDLAVLSESGPGPSALRVIVDAADTLCAAVLQPERPWHGGPALRGGVGETVRGTEALRPVAGRDNDTELPTSAGREPVGRGADGGDQPPPGTPGAAAAGGHHSGREHHRGAVVD